MDFSLLIDWLVSIVYLGLLLSWVPAAWATSILQIGVFVLAGALLIRQIISRESFRPSPDTVAVALIVLWGPLQILTHRSVNKFETWNSAMNWLTLAGVYLLAKTLLRERSVRDRFLSIQLGAGAALAVLSILFNFSSPHRIFGFFAARYVAYGPFIYRNHFAAFIEILLPVAFYKIGSAQRNRLPYAVLFASLFACMIASLSRTGVAIAITEIFALILLSWMRGKLSARTVITIGLPVAVLVAAFTLVVGGGAIWTRFHEQNFGVRAQLAHSTVAMIQNRPWTGFGLGAWRTVYPEFATFDLAVVANEAHNDWLQWTAEGGVVFAAVILFFAVWISRFAWKHLWGLGVPAIFLHCLIDYPTRNPAVAAFIFLFAGALAAAGIKPKPGEIVRDPEWHILSVRTAGD